MDVKDTKNSFSSTADTEASDLQEASEHVSGFSG